ncbi:MAG: hypothetical protein U0I89_08300 [Prevotella sp.]|nr:hypothetical protein [Prevotella sp.]
MTVLKILNTLLIVLFALMIVLVPLREQLRSFLRILFVAFFLDLLAIGIGEYIVGCMPPDNQEEQTDTVGSGDGAKEGFR